jgi:hypothetical protein
MCRPNPVWGGAAILVILVLASYQHTAAGTIEIFADGFEGNATTLAQDDAYTTSVNVTLTVATSESGLIGNDIYPAESIVSVAVSEGNGPGTSEGTLTLDPDGTFSFVPTQGFAGTSTFGYTLTNNSNGATSNAQVMIVVNGPPLANHDEVFTDKDTSITFDPRTNDSDPNGSDFIISRIVLEPSHGGATLDSVSITYTPNADHTGADSLVYEICDPMNLCATATVNITVG